MSLTSPKTKRKVTMRDVARVANVSQSTVSRILSPSSAKSDVPISEETKEKVLAVVRELGYQPNQYARSLRGQKTHVIAVLIGDIGNPFYHPIVRAVQDGASQYHYSVMVANSDHLREKEMLFCTQGKRGTLLANALFDRIQNNYNGPGRSFEVPCRFFERASA